MVPRQNGFHGPAFPTTRVTKQGGLVSTTMFNVVVDNVIRTWLAMTVENQRVDHDGLVEIIGQCLGAFCDDNGMVGSCNLDWLQHAMNVLVCLFRRYGLASNVAKSRTMTCQPGALRAGILEEAMALKRTGVGDLYRVRLRRWIPFPECRVDITTGSIMAHRRHMHSTELAINWSWLTVIQTVHQPQIYNVSFPQSTKQCPYPFPGCHGSSHKWNGLLLHFNSQHWGDRIRILEDHPNPLPRYE